MVAIELNFIIDKTSGLPLYIQLKNQIMQAIKDGILKVGHKMPTERELSEKLKVSRNTVSTAYSELEQDGVLKSYQGRGTFVAEEAKPWMAQNVQDKIIKFVDLGLEEALETGIDTEVFLEIVIRRENEKEDMMERMSGAKVG